MKTALRCLFTACYFALPVLMAGSLVAQSATPFASKAAAPLPREQLLEPLQRFFYTGSPSEADIAAPEMKLIESVEFDDYTRWHISYKLEKDDTGYAYVLLPKPMPTAEKTAPLVLVLHGTNGGGKQIVSGVEPKLRGFTMTDDLRNNRQYAVELARRGFIAFAPDMAGYGERTYLDAPADRFNQKHVAHFKKLWSEKWPQWRFPHGKQVWDIQRALDMIGTWDFVDQQNIGSIGHSLGAWATIYTMPLEPRIKAGVASAGGGLHFQRKLWEDQQELIKYMNNPTGHNMHNLMNVFIMATAPRAFLYIKPANDNVPYERQWYNHLDGYRAIADFYRQVLEAEGRGKENPQFDIYFHMEGHYFPPEARELAYAWLRRQLMPEGRVR